MRWGEACDHSYRVLTGRRHGRGLLCSRSCLINEASRGAVAQPSTDVSEQRRAARQFVPVVMLSTPCPVLRPGDGGVSSAFGAQAPDASWGDSHAAGSAVIDTRSVPRSPVPQAAGSTAANPRSVGPMWRVPSRTAYVVARAWLRRCCGDDCVMAFRGAVLPGRRSGDPAWPITGMALCPRWA